MRHVLFIAASLLTTVAVRSASADQCQVVKKDQSTWAMKHIKASGKIISWCERCSAPSPNTKSVPTKATGVKATPFKGGDPGDVEVNVNGKSIDLAYTYVQTGANTWANLAYLVGCPADGVQQFTDASAGPTTPPPPPGTKPTTPPAPPAKTGTAPPPPPAKTGAPPPPPPPTKK